jgi:UDP-GlcNAc:undecaprenyl-phosphate GlcNAc-1-phosphate transferase
VRWNILDIPNERSSHSRAVPLGGGVAIVCVNLAAWSYVGFITHIMSWQHALVFIVGALLVGTVSFIDDLGHVPYPVRLLVHGVAAAVFIFGYTSWNVITLPLLGALTLGAAGTVLTFFWIVGLTNAYNFMDGLDGTLSGQATAAGLGWIALGLLSGHPLLMGIGALTAASSLGFLLHNWHPARIFMGDVGSTFLGFSFAVLPVIAAHFDSRLALAGVLLVWPAVFDSSFTVARRLRRGENIFVGHRTFLFHRLIEVGWSQPAAASLYTALPIMGAVLACTWYKGNPIIHTIIGVTVGCACVGLWLLVRQQERRTTRETRRPAVVAVEDRSVSVKS